MTIARPPSITATLGLTQSYEIDFNSKKLSYYFAKLNLENNKKPNSNLQKVCELYLEIDRLLLLFWLATLELQRSGHHTCSRGESND